MILLIAAEARLRCYGRASGARVTLLRIPGIYALDRPGGGPRERVARGSPVLTAEDDIYTNQIHADDLARACLAALHRGRPQRAVHVCDDSERTMGEGASQFNAEDERIAVLLAGQAAVAVQNARLLDQVRGMQRQRDLFFAMMNHELRNALTGVYGWAERLVRPKATEHAEAARQVHEGIEGTIILLNNLLDLTRLDAGKVRPVWREVDPAAAVQRALTGFEPAAEKKRLSFRVEGPTGLAPFETDPVLLQQILVNLLSDAVRHSPIGGTIRVVLSRDGLGIAVRRIRLAVVDRQLLECTQTIQCRFATDCSGGFDVEHELSYSFLCRQIFLDEEGQCSFNNADEKKDVLLYVFHLAC